MVLKQDCGIEIQKFATELNKAIHVSHFPPGTSKWNKNRT